MTVDSNVLEAVGVIQGYLGDFSGAIATFSRGIELFPEDPRFYRHRGHRYINTRRLAEARDDFMQALRYIGPWENHIEYGRKLVFRYVESLLFPTAEPYVHPDVETLKAQGEYFGPLPFKVYYHLALVNYLLGHFEEAAEQFQRSMDYALTAELQVGSVNWLIIVNTRLGRKDKTEQLLSSLEFDGTPTVNAAYLDMLRVYSGEQDAEELLEQSRSDARAFATHGYGLGCWFMFNGDTDKAVEIFQACVEHGDPAAFGRIAAEIELERIG